MPDKNDFIEGVIDRIGLGGWERVQDFLYETKYKKIITKLEKKHREDMRNIIIFFILCMATLVAFNYFSNPSEQDAPAKTDYSPHSGWTLE